MFDFNKIKSALVNEEKLKKVQESMNKKITEDDQLNTKDHERIAKIKKAFDLNDEDIIITAASTGGQLVLTENGVIIGREGFFVKIGPGFTKGNKLIPYSTITAVQFKDPGITAGYIQFTVPGGIESKAGSFDAVKDENSVIFSGKETPLFHKVRDIVNEKIHESRSPVAKKTSAADEIAKLGDLLAKGLITEEEFKVMKSKVI